MDEKTLNKVLTKALENQEARLTTNLKSHMDQGFSDQARDMRDFTRQEIKASENRLTKRIDDSESKILLAVAETHDYFVLPRLASVEKRLLKLEAKAS